jgi:ferritin
MKYNKTKKKGQVMVSKEMIKKLNDQINVEFFSSNFYLQASAWCQNKSLDGCTAFFKGHAAEEMEHMHKFFDFVNETGALAIVGALDAPPTDFKSVKDLFKRALKHEKFVTSKIQELAAFAMSKKDFLTYNFLQWFISEQLEEENLFQSVVDKIDMVGDSGKDFYLLDKEIGQLEAMEEEEN